MIPRTLSTGVAVSLLAATASLVPTATTANGQEAAAATTSPTRYAMAASGYGTRVRGGDIPVSSDRTAFDAIGCTNRAGLGHGNSTDVDLGSLGTATAVETRVWTTSRNGTVSSYARNRIADVTLLGATAVSPVVKLNGIESLSRAFHDGTGFHASTSTKVASITLDMDGSGPLLAVNVSRPTPGNSVDVGNLGLVRISVGSKTEKSSASGAIAKRDALKITLIPTNTQIVLAHTRAEIHAGVVSGLFRGNAYGANATALDKALRLGKTPYVLMPCQGTNGKVIRNDTARVDPDNLILTGLTASERAAQSQSRADAYTEGRVAKANLGHGVVVRAIVGRANVHYVRGQGITRNIKGSTFGSVTLNGTPLKFGSDDVIRIGTVLTLRRNIVQRTPTSIEVTALQVRVLGADVVSVNLGHAKVGVKKSGL